MDEGLGSSERRAVRSHLKVTDAQVSAAKPVVEMSGSRPLSVKEFTRAQAELGFDIKDILGRDVATRAATLKSLYEADPSLLEGNRSLQSERLTEGLAYAYGVGEQSVADILKDGAIGSREVITILKNLSPANLGDHAAIAQLMKAVPRPSQPKIVAGIARGISDTSITDEAIGNRLISGLRSNETSSIFSSILKDIDSTSGPIVTLALKQIASRMGDHGSYAQAETEWLRDPQVDVKLKAQLLRVKRRISDAPHADSTFPVNQAPELVAALQLQARVNREVFEALAREPKKARLLAGAEPKSFEFVVFYLPEGGKKFKVGSPPEEEGRWDNESQREIVLTRSFEMQATPVTQRQWQLVMGNERQPNFSGNPDNPMESVSWKDAVACAKRLSSLDPKYNYRLPTEAEWEVAVRAGTRSRFSFGDSNNQIKDYAWFSENSGSKTHPVGQLKPNANGMYDMHGNVWEWMQDWYSSTPPEGVDPQGPNSGSSRVIRGGSWEIDAQYLRSAERDSYDPAYRYGIVGFRLVRTPK
ncbi:MAG: formylglycine-generating enzyme family protein [Deltaproteobacteria bacterium]|nr:formylglycine-generating enzyme family protein [Deltaproteobacteria bacterium]